MLADTVTDISTRIRSETSAGGLEVDGVLDLGQIAASQIGRSAQEVGQGGDDGGENDFGKLAGSLGSIRRLVNGQGAFPVQGKFSRDTASKLGVLGWVLLAVCLEKRVPLRLEGCAAFTEFGIELVGLLGHSKLLLWVEPELGLQRHDIVGLESCNDALSSHEDNKNI